MNLFWRFYLFLVRGRKHEHLVDICTPQWYSSRYHHSLSLQHGGYQCHVGWLRCEGITVFIHSLFTGISQQWPAPDTGHSTLVLLLAASCTGADSGVMGVYIAGSGAGMAGWRGGSLCLARIVWTIWAYLAWWWWEMFVNYVPVISLRKYRIGHKLKLSFSVFFLCCVFIDYYGLFVK